MIDLNKAVRDLINEGLKIDNYAIKANQNSPRPTSEYCSVKLFNVESKGQYDLKVTDNAEDNTDVDHTYEVLKSYVFDINLYKDENQSKANILNTFFKSSYSNTLATKKGVKILKVSDVNNITEALSLGYEFRSNIQVTISIVDKYTLEKVGVIEKLEISNEINNNIIKV